MDMEKTGVGIVKSLKSLNDPFHNNLSKEMMPKL